MTIGFDGSRAFVKNRTGTENYSYKLLRHLSLIDKTNNYVVYLRPGQRLEAEKDEWPNSFHFKTIEFPRLWTQLGLSAETFMNPPDLLFVPSHTLPLVRNPFLKTVITVHDLGAEYLPALHQLKQVLYLKFMTYIQLKTASGIIAVSKATRDDLVKKAGIEREKIKVVYEGVDPESFSSKVAIAGKPGKESADSILKNWGLEKEKYFLFAGTIQPRKNLTRLIQAFSMFLQTIKQERGQDFKLVLAGQKGWKTDDIYSLPKELGIENSVLFTGRVSDTELKNLYRNAIALTFVSLFEGFGLPVLEAFASDCAVIASDTSSIPEVAGDAALLVDPYKPEKIAEAMIKIVKNDKLRYQLIHSGRVRIKQFTWQKAALETLKILESASKK